EQQCTGLEPCRSLYARVQQLCNERDILCVNIFLGFPYADVAEMGSAVVVVANRKKEVAYELGKKIENKIRQTLGAYNGVRITATDAVDRIATAAKPVLLLDMGDNIGGGAPGNSTVLLRLLNEDKRYRFFICIYDPGVVREAGRHVPGSSFVVTINEYPGKGENYTCEIKLIRAGDGKFREDKPVHGGKLQFDMGRIAVAETTGNGIVLFTSLRMPPFSLRQLTSFGIHPHDFDVVVAKGVNAPLAAYNEACPSVVQADTPGVTQADATRFIYQKRRKPMYPFESIEECNAAII
ncbi:MAG TPA: MlrC C-terminal domain-containing protein, partial [Agriterribacter sp.]|nr:MlrC C-terminal domain-containing protein [Agriterribacter sp.]